MIVCRTLRLSLPGPRRHPGDADRRGPEAGQKPDQKPDQNRPRTEPEANSHGPEAGEQQDVTATSTTSRPSRALDAGGMLGDRGVSRRSARAAYDDGARRVAAPVARRDRGGDVLRDGRVGGGGRRGPEPLPSAARRAGRGEPRPGAAGLLRSVDARRRSSYSGRHERDARGLRRGARTRMPCDRAHLRRRARPHERRGGRRADRTGTGGLMPRAALGHLAFGVLGALEAAGLLPRLARRRRRGRRRDGAARRGARSRISRRGPNAAKTIAQALGDPAPVIWGADGFAAMAANRWRTQWNENAKLPAFSSALPELDHNEVVGWAEERGAGSPIVALRHDDEHPDVAARFPLSLEIARRAGAETRGGHGQRHVRRSLGCSRSWSCSATSPRRTRASPAGWTRARSTRSFGAEGRAGGVVVTAGLPGPGDDLAARRPPRSSGRATSSSRGSASCSARASGRRSATRLAEDASFAFTDLPGFPPSGVPGHAGRLVLGTLAGVPVAAFSGRVHFYEGHGMDVPALLPRLARELGARHDGGHRRGRRAAREPRGRARSWSCAITST